MNAKQLEEKYNTLVSELNQLTVILCDAESAMVEEVSSNGFASKKTTEKVETIREQLSDADFNLYCFKQDNAAFVAELKSNRAKARKEEAERSFEAFWNN